MNNITAKICDIKHFAVHDGPGIRTTIFFKECPLHCLWCHNPESISKSSQLGWFRDKCTGCGSCTDVCSCHQINNGKHEFDRSNCTGCGKCVDACLFDALELYGRNLTLDAAIDIVFKDKAFYAESGGGVTLSGGEPLLQLDFCVELFKRLKNDCINTAVDTCGQVPWNSFEKIIPWTDMFLYDFKHADSTIHKKLTGSRNELIKENLVRLSLTGKKIEIRMPLISGLNTDDSEIHAAGIFLKNIKHITAVKLLSYHNLAHAKYRAVDYTYTLPDVPPLESKILEHISLILRSYGLHVIY